MKKGFYGIWIDGEEAIKVEDQGGSYLEKLIEKIGEDYEDIEIVLGSEISESSYVCQGCGAVHNEEWIMVGLSDEGSDWTCVACGLTQDDINVEN